MLDVGRYSRYNVFQLIGKIRGPLSWSVHSASIKLKASSAGAIMQAAIESLLESFPEGATAIGPDARILEVNSYLAARIRPCVGKTCYEALASLDEACPFCPFEDLVTGSANRRFKEFRSDRIRNALSKHVLSNKEKMVLF